MYDSGTDALCLISKRDHYVSHKNDLVLWTFLKFINNSLNLNIGNHDNHGVSMFDLNLAQIFSKALADTNATKQNPIPI